MKKFFLLPAIAFSAMTITAQYVHQPNYTGPPENIGKINWTVSPFEQKVFIENKGQYEPCLEKMKDRPGAKIEYAVDNMGTKMYFTKSGIVYHYVKYERPDKKEERIAEKEEDNLKVDQVFVRMDWEGANPGMKFEVEDKVNDYYSYSDPNVLNGTIWANAYKKLIIKDLYPNIDAVYEFPAKLLPEYYKPGENRCYLEYSFIVHPGGDPNLIKMKYSGDGKLSSDENIHIKTIVGDIVNTAPKSKYFDADAWLPINSSFAVNGNVVSFHVADYNNQRSKLVIDPWTVNPNFPTVNKAYDIDKDGAGNLYVSGGNPGYVLKKFTPAGALTWTYNWPNVTSYYGDHCTEMGGNVYISYGPWIGNNLTKITTNAVVIFNNTNANTTYPQGETYRLTQNCVTGNLNGGGFAYNGSITSATTVFNVSTTTGNFSGFVNPTTYTEIRTMTNDAAGNVYALAVAMPSGSNQLFKLAPVSLATIFNISSGYALTESQATYCPNWFSGLNGVAVGCDIYTFDGATLMRRNKTTGALVTSIAVPGGSAYNNSGLCLDGCGNVYVGTGTDVKKYDGSLTYITNGAMGGAVYDICLGNIAGEVIAVGNGFMTSVNLGVCTSSLNVTLTSTPAGCSQCNGTATATVSGGCSGASYAYSWAPSGGTNSTATGLCTGTYTVTVSDAAQCTGATVTQTVTITGSGGNFTLSSATTNPVCNGQCTGTATATPSGGSTPFTYSWNTTPVQTAQTATGLCAGNYTVTVTDNGGCTNTVTVAITQPPPLTLATAQTNPQCNGQCNGTATVTASGGNTPYTYLWNNGQTTSNATGLCANTYTVTVTAQGGCNTTIAVTITQPPALSLSTSSNAASCSASNGTATVTPSGGTSPYTYQWNNGQTAQTATGLSTGNYTVTVTDANGCTQAAVVTVNNTGNVSVTAAGNNPLCNGQCTGTATATPSGGTSPYTYLWNNGQTSSNATGLCAGTYSVTLTDVNGCTSTASIAIVQPPVLTASIPSVNTICIGQNSTLNANANGGTTGYTYNWSNGGTSASITVNPSVTTSYTVTVTDANGCTSTATVQVNVNPPLAVTATGNTLCAGGNTTISASGSGGSGSGYTYTWNTGQTGTPVTVSPTATTTYTVTLTDNCGSPSATNTVQVTVNPLPIVTFAADTLYGCAPLCVNFTNNTANSSTCMWTTSAPSSSSNCNYSYCFNNPGSYNVTLQVTDNNGCSSQLTLNNYINVYAQPTAAFTMSPQTTTIMDPTICFTNNSINANSYTWFFGDSANSTSTLVNPCFTYTDTGTYCVKLAVKTNNNCVDTIINCLIIEPDVAIYVPNAFTPNGDSWNNTFFPQGVGIDPNQFEMWIFDRWGNLIWHTTTWGQGWDGRANGGKDIAQEDVYVWKIVCRDVNSLKHSLIGHVTLIK